MSILEKYEAQTGEKKTITQRFDDQTAKPTVTLPILPKKETATNSKVGINIDGIVPKTTAKSAGTLAVLPFSSTLDTMKKYVKSGDNDSAVKALDDAMSKYSLNDNQVNKLISASGLSSYKGNPYKNTPNAFQATGDWAKQSLKNVGTGIYNTWLDTMADNNEQQKVFLETVDKYNVGVKQNTDSIQDIEQKNERLYKQIADNTANLGKDTQALYEKYAELSPVDQKMSQYVGSAAQVIPTALSGLIHPALPYAILGAQSYGNSMGQAIKEGATVKQARTYGGLEAIKEIAVEKLVGGIPGLGKGAIPIEKATSKLFSSPLVKMIATRAFDVFGEGAEEVVADALSPYLQRLTYDSNAPLPTKEQLIDSFGGGAVASLLLGVPVDTANYISNKSTIPNNNTRVPKQEKPFTLPNIKKETEQSRSASFAPFLSKQADNATSKAYTIDNISGNNYTNNRGDTNGRKEMDAPGETIGGREAIGGGMEERRIFGGRNSSDSVHVGLISSETRNFLDQAQKPNINLRSSTENPAAFSYALSDAIASSEHGAYVSPHTAQELTESGANTYLSADGMAGMAVWQDGNIGAVFNNDKSPIRGAAYDVMLTALSNGGNKLDNFDGTLSRIYARFGFTPVARVPFNREYAPDGWNYEKFGEPDVVFWMHNGDSPETVAKNIKNYPLPIISNLPAFDDYDSAYAYRDSLMKGSPNGSNNASFGKNTVGSAESLFDSTSKVSKVRSNTIENSPMFSQAEKDLMQESLYEYNTESEAESLQNAKQRIELNFNGEVQDLSSKSNFNGEDLDTAMGILEQYMKEGQETGDFSKAIQWSKIIQEKGTDAGQMIQAFAKYSRTPEGKVIKAQKTVENAQKKTRKSVKNQAEKTFEETKNAVKSSEEQATKKAVSTAQNELDNIEKSIKSAMKDFDITLKEIVRKNSGDKAKIQKDIQDYLMYNLGLENDADIEIISQKIADTYQKTLHDTAKAEIERIFSKKKTKKSQKSLSEKVLDLINMGAYTDADFMNIANESEKIPTLSAEEAKNIYEYMQKSKEYADGSYDQRLWESRANQIIANKEPATFREKFRGLQRISMLINPTTIISRNPGGNVIMGTAETIKDIPATLIDKAVSIKTGKRTTTMNPHLLTQAKAFVKGISELKSDIKNSVDTAPSRGQFELPNKRIFQSDFLNSLDQFVRKALSAGDRGFYEAAYAKRMSEQNSLGITGEKAEENAKLYALDRTFQNNSVLAKKATKIRNELGVAGDLIAPFVQTPANIMDKLLDYSPVGLIKSVYQLGKASHTGEFDQKLFVDTLGRTFTGTGAIIYAFSLAAKGILTGGKPDDQKEYEALKETGWQPYSIKIGNKYYSYDWAQPIGGLIAASVDAYSAGLEKSDVLEAIGVGSKSGINSVFTQSFLSGLLNLFSGYDPASGIGKFILGSTTQITPSGLAAVTRTIDPYFRDTYDTDAWVSQGKKLAARIPGLSTILPKKIGADGQPEIRNQGRDIGSRALENLLSPGYLSETQNDPVNKELLRLNKTIGSKEQFLKTAPNDLTYDSEKLILTDDEKRQYQRTLGTLSQSTVSNIIQDKGYKNASDDIKAKYIVKALDYANDIAKKEYLDSKGIDYNLSKFSQYVEDAINVGVSASEFIIAYYDIDQLDGEKDEKGKTITGSIKKEAQSYVDNLSLKQEQKDLIMQSAGYSIGIGNKTTKAFTLPGIPKPNKTISLPSIKNR